MTRCPNNENCNIVFIQEENDSGDSHTPYFATWTSYIYSEEDSEHVEGCTPLTEKQIQQLEEERANDIDYEWTEPI